MEMGRRLRSTAFAVFDLGSAGSMVGTRQLVPAAEVAVDEPFAMSNLADAADDRRLTDKALSAAEAKRARDALQFFFSSEGDLFRTFLLDEVVAAADVLSREAAYELASTLSLESLPAPSLIKQLVPALSPPLSTKDQQVVSSIRKLVAFLLGDTQPQQLLSRAASVESLQQIQALLPVIADNQAQMRRFGLQIVGRLAEKQTSRAFSFLRSQIAAI